MDEDSQHIKEFRNLLRRIKQQIINNTLSGQNTEILKTKVEDKLIQLYKLLEPVIFDYKAIDTIPLEEYQKIFKRTLGIYNRSPTYQTNLEYYLKSDLINNPFTIDTDVIDDTKYLPTPVFPQIINNNNDLTIEDQYDSE
uniref:Uncharacterized protein n=1 Tax=viral metagenome TaxID=1070528 RepID=A0A6C0IFX9_9ZZZZ